MIRIRVNRAPTNRFVELHLDQSQQSVTFPGSHYVTVKDLDDLIATLLEVQRFMEVEPEDSTRKWEVS